MTEGKGYTLKEAAKRLGYSERSVRNWAKDGKIKADKVLGEHGKEWRIWLTEDEADSIVKMQGFPEPEAETALAPLESQLVALETAVAKGQEPLQADIQALTEAIKALRATIEQPRKKEWWRIWG